MSSPSWMGGDQKARPTARNAVPFVLVAVLGLGSTLLPPYAAAGRGEAWLMSALFLVGLGLLVVGLRRSERTWADPAPAFLFFVVLALARDLTGGSQSGLGALLALPILWLAITGTRRDLHIATVLTPLVFVVPLVLVGAPDYTSSDWRRALGWTAFAVLVAPVIHRIVQQLTQAEARWRVLMDHLPDMTVVVVDEDCQVKVAAGAGAERQGMRGTEGRPLAEVSPPENFAVLSALVERALRGSEASGEIVAAASDSEHEITVTPLPSDRGEPRALILGRNVAEERKRERALVRAKNRAERLFEDAPHGVAVLAPDGTVIQANTAMLAITGLGHDRLAGRTLAALSRPGDDHLTDHLRRVRSGAGASVETDWTLRNHAGQDVHVVLSSRALAGDDESGDAVLLNVVDVSERRRYEQRLAHLADHDVLTGLANRRLFERELESHLERCRRYGPTGALLLLDLDNFKEVNDTLGHGAGDQLIISTGALLRNGVRSNDVVARLGGDEFAVLLVDGDRAAAEAVAQSIVARVREHTATLDGTRRRVTASVGVVTLQAASGHAVDLLALADMTMYDAKDAGRNQYVVLDEDSTRPPRSGARLEWQSRIERALEDDAFVLHLQPIQNLHTGTIHAAEALIRMREGADLIPPSRFLYIAERAGLMPAVDRWVVAHAVEMLAALRVHEPGFQLEVNLSGLSIGHPETEAAIVDALRDHAVDPAALILEITETAAVADVEAARQFAERMTALGCHFALDDFGAGFGSFYYLKHLLFDYVKIDGEFVSGCHTSEVDRTILRSIVGIARDLGKQTVAEFVSDPTILDVVRVEGVDHAQGFLIGEPVPYDEFVTRFFGPDRIRDGVASDHPAVTTAGLEG